MTVADEIDRTPNKSAEDWRASQRRPPDLAGSFSSALAKQRRRRIRVAAVSAVAAAMIVVVAVVVGATRGQGNSSAVASCAPQIISFDSSQRAALRDQESRSVRHVEAGETVEVYGWNFYSTCHDTVRAGSKAPVTNSTQKQVEILFVRRDKRVSLATVTPDESAEFVVGVTIPSGAVDGPATISAGGGSVKIEVIIGHGDTRSPARSVTR